MSDNAKSTPFSDVQSFLIGDDGKIYFWITSKLKKLNEKWASAIVPLNLLNFIHEKLTYIKANVSDPLLVIEYLRKSEPEKYDALFIKSQFTKEMAQPLTHLKIKLFIYKSLNKLLRAEGNRADKTSKTMLANCNYHLSNEIRDIREHILMKQNFIFDITWEYKEKWEQVEEDLSLLDTKYDKTDYLREVKQEEMNNALRGVKFEDAEDLAQARDKFLEMIDIRIGMVINSPFKYEKEKVKEVKDLRDLFKDKDKYILFMNFLVEKEIIDENYSWLKRKKPNAAMAKCVCLVKSLESKGYLERKPTIDEILLISKHTFQFGVSESTARRDYNQKYRGFLNEIPHSKHLPIPPNPDHSTN